MGNTGITQSVFEQHRTRILDDMRRKGLTIAQLARLAGVDRSGLSRFLGGDGNPTTDYLEAIYLALRAA